MTSPQGVNLMSPTQYGNLHATVRELVAGVGGADRQSLVVLWGSRGSGKTTALSYLASALPELEPEQPLTALGPFDANDFTPDAYARLINDAAAEVQGSPTKIVILLDNLDALARTPRAAALYEFEQDVLVSLVQLEDVTIVATSRTPLTWRDWETRTRHQSLAIPYLDQETVRQQAIEHGASPEDAFRVTLGHPQLLQWLFTAPDISESELAIRSAAYFLDGLPAATAEYATLLSLLPSFDVAVLREVAPLEGGDAAQGFYSDYLDRLHDLVAAGIITWSADTGGYQFLDGVVRCHLARSFRFRRPDDAYRIHQRAASHFQAEAARPGVLQSFFVSVIYHLASAATITGAKPSGRSAVDWVQANLSGWVDARRDTVVESWRTGAGDWVVRDELDRLIGAEDNARIKAWLETGPDTLAGSDNNTASAAQEAEMRQQEPTL